MGLEPTTFRLEVGRAFQLRQEGCLQTTLKIETSFDHLDNMDNPYAGFEPAKTSVWALFNIFFYAVSCLIHTSIAVVGFDPTTSWL